MKFIKFFALVAIFATIFVSCEKQELETEKSENTYKYSKNIVLKTSQYEVYGVMQSDDENLLENTDLDVFVRDSIIQNNEICVSEEIDDENLEELENVKPDISLNFTKVKLLDTNIILEFVLKDKQQEKCLYPHTAEMTWFDINFSVVTVSTLSHRAETIFKYKYQGGIWRNIFRKHLKKYASVSGQVPVYFYKLRLKIRYRYYPQVYYE